METPFSHEVPERLEKALGRVLEPGEEVVLVQSDKKGTVAYVLTERRFLTISHDKMYKSIPFSDIKHVDVGGVRIPGRPGDPWVMGFRMQIRGEDKEIYLRNDREWFGHGWVGRDADLERVWRLRFPTKLCELAGLSYAPPMLVKSKDGTIVDFYPDLLPDGWKLAWPQKCASCLTSLEEAVFDELKIYGNRPACEIPYCQSCHSRRFKRLKKSRAVKPEQGYYKYRKRVWFEVQTYAEEFLALNFEEQRPFAPTG